MSVSAELLLIHHFFTAIKSALSKEDLAPDIEEKLMQLQKYNSEQTKKEEGTGLLTSSSAAVTTNSATRNTTSKRIRDQVRHLADTLTFLPRSSSLYAVLTYLSFLVLMFIRK